MAKGSSPKRESKKPKKASTKKSVISVPIASAESTQVMGKRKKRKDTEV
jgi:hypothetical protein